MRRLPKILAASVALLAFAGCSSEGDVLQTSAAVSGTGNMVSADVVRAATESISTADAVDMDMRMVVAAEGEVVEMHIVGQVGVDPSTLVASGELTTTVSVLGESMVMSMRIVDDVIYARFDSLPAEARGQGIDEGVWYSLDLADAGVETPVPGTYDPEQLLGILDGVFAEAEDLGTRDIDGHAAQGYRMELTAADFGSMAGLMGDAFGGGMDPDAAAAELEGSTMTMEMWVADHFVEMSVDATIVSTMVLGETTMQMDARMTPVDGVTVEAPADAVPMPGTGF